MCFDEQSHQVSLLAVQVVTLGVQCHSMQERLRQLQLKRDAVYRQLVEVCCAHPELHDSVAPVVSPHEPLQGVKRVATGGAPKASRRRGGKPKLTTPPVEGAGDEQPGAGVEPPPGVPLTMAVAHECSACGETAVCWDPALGQVICRACSYDATHDYIERAGAGTEKATPVPKPPTARRRPRRQPNLPGVK